MKKIIALLLVVAMTAAASVAGTIAYLQDEDSDVNVMTVGNVYIEQIEQERDENGDLVTFTQGKPAVPAVYDTIAWDDDRVNVNGTGYKVFDADLKNVIDKIVTVKNTGRSDAFVRTVIAIEAPEGDPNDLIHINYNGDDSTISPFTKVEIGGVDYVIASFTYTEALPPKEISAPSLVQVFLDKAVTNEDVEKFGDLWDIKVVSQAIQADGFDTAEEALEAGFGDITATNHPWVIDTTTTEVVENIVELKNALEGNSASEDVNIVYNGSEPIVIDDYLTVSGNVVLSSSNPDTVIEIAEDKTVYVENGSSLELSSITLNFGDRSQLSVGNNSTLILGSGTVVNADTSAIGSSIVNAYGTSNLVLDGAVIKGCSNNGAGELIRVTGDATLTIEEGTMISGNTISGGSSYALILVSDDATVIMNGGSITDNQFDGKGMIRLERNAEFIINGGEICDNKYIGTSTGSLVVKLGSGTKFEVNGGNVETNV